MYMIDGEITEKIEYARHLPSGAIQIVDDKADADSIWLNRKCIPLDSEVKEFNVISYLSNKLNGVTENDIPET